MIILLSEKPTEDSLLQKENLWNKQVEGRTSFTQKLPNPLVFIMMIQPPKYSIDLRENQIIHSSSSGEPSLLQNLAIDILLGSLVSLIGYGIGHFVNERELFRDQLRRITPPGTPVSELALRSSLLEMIPPKQRDDFVSLVEKISTPTGPSLDTLETLLCNLNRVRLEEDPNFIALIAKLTSESINIYEMDNLISGLNRVPPEERPQFVSLLLKIGALKLYSQFVCLIMFHLSKISPTERNKVFHLTSSLTLPGRSTHDKARIFSSLARIHLKEKTREQEVFLSLLESLIPFHLEHSGEYFFDFLKATDPTKRNEHLARALQVLREELPRLGNEPGNKEIRLRDLLLTPFDQEFPPLERRLFADGIDVHHGYRAKKTRHALEKLLELNLLCSTQDGKGPEALIEEFKNYLRSFEDKNIQAAALLALTGPTHGTIFPALLENETVSIYGLVVHSKTLFANILAFVNTYTDPVEADPDLARQSLRKSVVLALADSVDGAGNPLCNLGKWQRICCRVLQGRLKGVNLDDLPLTLGQACEMFIDSRPNKALYEEISNLYGHVCKEKRKNPPDTRLIEDATAAYNKALESFFLEGNKFCDENPSVNKTEFLSILRDLFGK